MNKVQDVARGGFGRVEKWQRLDGSFFARKIFEPHIPGLSSDDVVKLRKRFDREVKIQSQLSTDYVVPIIVSDLPAQPPNFDMPFCDSTLETLLADPNQTAEAVATAFADILNALEYIHSLGYVHRDLKPMNVLHHDGKWKLSDFGLVLPQNGSTTSLTSVGSAWGSTAYAAPEQATSFGTVKCAADIYSFGCILHDYYARSSRIPYQRYTAPGSIGLIIEKCTEVDWKRRFKSINGLRAALLTCLASATAHMPSASAGEWLDALKRIAGWDDSLFQEFAHFLDAEAMPEDIDAICTALDEEMISTLFTRLPDEANVVAKVYCEWTDRSHIFAFCDVIVNRLERIFDMGTFDSKASALIHIAKLGSAHNRWFVMKRLISVCGNSLQDDVAARVAIEIIVSDAQLEFTKCAEHIDRSVADYHPKIRSVLQSN